MATTTEHGAIKCDWRYAKIISMVWVPVGPEDIPACCAKKYSTASISYEFCVDMCSLCCKKLVIDFECTKTTPDPVNATKKTYPTVTPTDSGISFTTSAYGAPLPIVFGSDKLTGNVFWASPVRKVAIDATSYYKTLDFAFGICEGEINGVLRMWMGTQLIWDRTVDVDGSDVVQPTDGFIAGATIDLTDPSGPLRNVSASARQTKISVFTGSERQLPEGIMVTRDGYDQVPGYRGTAYVLFENFIVSDTSIPNLFVEVTSNTAGNIPRIYGVQVASPSTFDYPAGNVCLVDLSYDQVTVDSRKASGSPVPAGFTTFDYNNFTNNSEDEFRVAYSYNLNYPVSRLMQATGFIMTSETSSNAGILRVWNPLARIFTDTLGPGGGVSDHNLVTGMSALNRGSIAFVGRDPIYGSLIDVYMGIGVVNGVLGFATVNDEGKINFVSKTTAMNWPNARAAFYKVDSDLASDNPTFIDGGDTAGDHVYLVTGQTTATDFAYIYRCTVYSSAASLDAPVLTLAQTINVDDLAGAGFHHDHKLVLVDPVDKNLVIFTLTSSDFGVLVWKYNPFTGEIVWKTSATGFQTDGQGSDQAYLVGQTYVWVANGSDGIYSLDMAQGIVTTVKDSLIPQSLANCVSGSQFYNGAENSVTYLTQTTAKHVTKVYLDRVARETVALGAIVKSLLQRVGLSLADMNITDIESTALTGYTIAKRQSLRTSFSELAQVFKYDVVESNGKIVYKTRGEDAVATIDIKYLGDDTDGGWLSAEDTNDIAAYRKLNLTYRDIGREYANNVQNIIFAPQGNEEFDNDSAIDVTVPIVLDASNAKLLAEILLYAKLTYDTTFKFSIPPYFLDLDPGDVINVVDGSETTTMRIRNVNVGSDKSLEVEASLEDPDIYNDTVNLFGTTGDFDASAFPAVQPRVDILVMEVPYLTFDDAQETSSSLFLYAVCLNHRASATVDSDVAVTIDGTDDYTLTKPTNFPTWGYCTAVPSYTGSKFTYDLTRSFTIKMISTTGITPADSTLDDVLSSAQINLCYCAGELLQFTDFTDNGNGTYTITGLVRGKLGTDNRTNNAVIGDKFVFLSDTAGNFDTAAIRRIDVISDQPRHAAQFFLPVNNPFQPAPIALFTARNLAAWSVADLKIAWSSTDVVVDWKRRVRFNGEWADDGSEYLDLTEIDETYVVFFYTDQTHFSTTVPDSYLRRVDLTDTTTTTYTAAQQTADGFDGTTTTLYCTVYQQGGVEGNRYGTPRTITLLHR